ncbi:hypothetical protein GGS21DRAFT_515863 [Xylaria nigripes]|nr:hypothetical protein GGS21DRAFT_515863 [Xylaria nigripes]
MSAEPLDSVTSNVPDWLRRLDELNGQIEQRQLELAKFAEARPLPSARSIRNRGSTESLRPKEDDAPPQEEPNPIADKNQQSTATAVPPLTPNGNHRPNPAQAPSTPASDPWSGSSLLRHTNELVATAQRRARATVHKRQKTDSMLSAEGTTPKYRSRKMVKVYYDSYVQSFFEELVKYVSAQRNLFRKAKMAAKVAHIRHLVELEIPDGDDAMGDDTGGDSKPGNDSGSPESPHPAPNSRQGAPAEMKLPYINSRTYRGAPMNPATNLMPRRSMGTSALNGRLGSLNEKGDIWDELDKGLEYVQGMCERAAHQFLRDGDCSDELEKIKGRLVKVQELAVNEKERLSAEKSKDDAQTATVAGTEPSQATAPESGHGTAPEYENNSIAPRVRPEEGIKSRTFRPSTMRRQMGPSSPSKGPAQHDVLEIDEGIEVDVEDFKPCYRTARRSRRP